MGGGCGRDAGHRVIRRAGTKCRLYSHDRYVNSRICSEVEHGTDSIEETEFSSTGRFSTMHLLKYPLT